MDSLNTLLDNFYPVSILSFLGKIIERVEGFYLQTALDEATFWTIFSLEIWYSTETVLVVLADGNSKSCVLQDGWPYWSIKQTNK